MSALQQEQRIEDLEGEVAYWRAEAMGNTDASRDERLRRAFKLTGNEAWITGRLYALDGRLMLRSRIHDDMPTYTGDERGEANTVDVLISRIRTKLGRESVLTVRGSGYAMSPVGLALCRETLT